MRRLLGARAVSVLLLVLTGTACSLGPRYQRPAIPPPRAWQSTTESGAATPTADWWHGFGSAELERLLDLARHSNDDLAAGIARVREADAQERIAGASLLPALAASGTATRERAPVSGAGIRTFDQFVPLLTASYEFDFWGRNRATHAAARAAAAASRYDRDTLQLTVLTGVASTYFQVLEVEDRLAAAEANLAAARQVLVGLAREAAVGTATALDVSQQETLVATLEASLPALRLQRRQARDALAVLLGMTPDALSLASTTLAGIEPPAAAPGLPSDLLSRRPDVASAEAQLIAANANVAAARAAFFPTISLTGTGGYESAALAGLLTPANRVWSLGAGIVQPIFAGGAIYGQSEYAKARYAELLAGYHKAVVAAFANVEDALAAVEQTTEQLARQQHAAAQADRSFDFARAQLEAGTINVVALLTAESARDVAHDALAQARFARLQASLDLYKALGGGWARQGPENAVTSATESMSK